MGRGREYQRIAYVGGGVWLADLPPAYTPRLIIADIVFHFLLLLELVAWTA